MLVPLPCQGTNNQIDVFPGYEWIKKLPNKKIYFALFQRWPDQPLPSGYDYYIISFHLEAVDVDWLKQQQVTGMIIVLFDGHNYNLEISGVHFIPFFYWHYQLQTMQDWFGPQQEKKQLLYKFSAVCNRISQSKIWITTKLLESAKESSLILLNSWFEEKNVHHWKPTGNAVLDQLTQTFRDRYLGQEIKIDQFDNQLQNIQTITSNPWQSLYQDCAIHFTNESFHYSNTFKDNECFICPGPFLTEKTLKCLLGGTAFIPVGQFETYKMLNNLGLEFDYNFDTSWDNDPGDLTRFSSIVELIDSLAQFEIEQLIEFTQHSSIHNQNYIVSGLFFNQCQEKNSESIEKINNLIS